MCKFFVDCSRSCKPKLLLCQAFAVEFYHLQKRVATPACRTKCYTFAESCSDQISSKIFADPALQSSLLSYTIFLDHGKEMAASRVQSRSTEWFRQQVRLRHKQILFLWCLWPGRGTTFLLVCQSQASLVLEVVLLLSCLRRNCYKWYLGRWWLCCSCFPWQRSRRLPKKQVPQLAYLHWGLAC